MADEFNRTGPEAGLLMFVPNLLGLLRSRWMTVPNSTDYSVLPGLVVTGGRRSAEPWPSRSFGHTRTAAPQIRATSNDPERIR